MVAPDDSQELNSYTQADVDGIDQVIFSDQSATNEIKRDDARNVSRLQSSVKTYSASQAEYKIGDKVLEGDIEYRNIVAITVAEAFDSAKWQSTSSSSHDSSWKLPVIVATTEPITLSNSQTIDGIIVSNPDRVLVKDQAVQSTNGIYEVTDSGAWVRTSDMDSNEDYVGATVWVEQGNVNMDTAWFQTGLIINGVNLVFRLFAKSQSINWKEHVRIASTANIDLSSASDPNPIDGVTLNTDQRILLKDQTILAENGIYVAVDAEDPTTWVRSADMNQPTQFATSTINVDEGTINSLSQWYETEFISVVDTTDVIFLQNVGAGLEKSHMLIGNHDDSVKKFDPNFNVKFDSRVATTAQVNFETDLDNGSTIDDIVLATGDMVLVKDQNDQVDFANMTDNGDGYGATPTVTFDITDTNATVTPVATAVMNGGGTSVIGLLFSNPGAGMTKLPLIVFTGGSPSTPASADAVGLRASNGIYEVQASGQPIRSSDADTSNKVQNGMFTVIEEGTTNADKPFTLTTIETVTLDVTSLHFEHVNFAKNYRLFNTLSSDASDTRTNHVINLGNTQVIAWRNAAGDGEVKLNVNANDSFVFNVDDSVDYIMTLLHMTFGGKDVIEIKDLKLNSDTTHSLVHERTTDGQSLPYSVGEFISKYPILNNIGTYTKIDQIVLSDADGAEEGQLKLSVLSAGTSNIDILTLDKVSGIDAHSTPIINVPDPVVDQGAATKIYVDTSGIGVFTQTFNTDDPANNQYFNISGVVSGNAGFTNRACVLPKDMTLKRLTVNASVGPSADTEFIVSINESSGSQIATVLSGQTGSFTDTSGSDAITSGDLAAYRVNGNANGVQIVSIGMVAEGV